MKKIMNMKKTFAAILAASMAASAATAVENQELLESKVDSINAKRGLEITGAIRAVAQSSRFETDNDYSGLNHMPNVEKDEFVTADINFGFRPWENVRANAMVRLGAGMQEYFASAAKTVSVAWLNVEGNLDDSFYWVVGDFRQQYSPLTLFLPSLDIMYEPQIFARKRYMAEHEQMIEGNQRNLQGVNLQFRKDLGSALGQVRAEGLFARINRTAVLDLGGAEGSIMPNEQVWGASQAANMDKFLLAGNFELLPVNRNVYVGVTPMYIFDNEDSYSYTYRHPKNNYTNPYEREPINPYELNPQKTLVVSGRLGADVASLIGNNNLILDVTGEFAMSNDKVYTADSSYALQYDEMGNLVGLALNEEEEPYVALDSFHTEDLSGTALLVNANVGYKNETFGARLGVDFVMNDSNWFNNLAQSPRFFAQRIQNSDKDGLASVAVSLVAVAEGFVVMAGINDVSVLRQVKNVQVGEFGGVVRFEHNRLAGCRCANYFVCIVQKLVHQLRVCDGGFVQDFKNEHRVRSDGVQFGSDLCPQMQEMFLFGVVGFRIGAELVAGIVQFHIVVEVHDDGEALRQGELDIFLYAGETFGVDRMGAIVGILLPTNRETDGVEARRLDYGEIGIFDAVAPAAIQGVALRIPRVPQVHALA